MTRPHSPDLRAKDAAYWGALHVRSDRSPPIFLSDLRKRQPSGTSISIWKRGKGGNHVYE